MKRRNLKANEVEAMFNEVRKLDADFSAGEQSIVRTIMETAKRNGRIGDKVLLVLPPYYIHIPDWQRKADLLRAREIGIGYNKHKWEVPKIVYTDGILKCVDGMHRILGALVAKIPDIVVEVMEISEEEAIELFLGQSNDRGHMKPMDYYNASIKANKPEYIEFREVCHKHNVQVRGDDALVNPVGTFTSITEGVKTEKRILDQVLTLIDSLRWNGKETNSLSPSSAAYGTKVVRSIKKLYAYHEGNEAQMEKALLSRCKGTEWFIKNLADMPQYYIFDLMNKVVSDAIAQRDNLTVTGTSKRGKKTA